MKEKIVLTNSINEKEMLRSMSLNGTNTFGLRFMNMDSISEIAIVRNSIEYNKTKIDSNTKLLVIYNSIKNSTFFKKSSLKDAKSIMNTIDDLRKNILKNEKEAFNSLLLNGEFIDKNKEIIRVYNEYIDYLNTNNMYDQISLARYIIDNKISIKADFYYFNQYLYKPLEKEFLRVISKENNQEFKYPFKNRTKIKEYINAYGSTNEIEHVLNTIYTNNLKFDECTVVVTNPALYQKTFEDYQELYNLPITYGTTKSISSSNPGKLLKAIVDWNNDFNSLYELKNIIYSDYFNSFLLKDELNIDDITLNKLIDIVGSLRLSFNYENNLYKINKLNELYIKRNQKDDIQFIHLLNIINNSVFKDIPNLLKYSKIKNDFDTVSLNKMVELLNLAILNNIDTKNIIDYIFSLSISLNNVKEGNLYVTTLSKAKSVIRNNLFILGLSSDQFPGNPKENHILLDSDYALFNVNNKSSMDIENKINDFNELINIFEANGSNIYLSYSSYNLSDLKTLSQSSVLLETYMKEVGGTTKEFEDQMVNVNYFDSNISKINKLGKSCLNINNKIVTDSPNKINEASSSLDYKKYNFSASIITDYFKCQYLFYLKKIIGLKEPYIVDSTEVIPANEMGTLIHKVLELKEPSKTSQNDFIKFAKELFDDYLIENVPISKEIAKIDFDRYMSYINNAYILGQDDIEVISKESDSDCIHESGLRIHGLPDLITKRIDGTVRIVDYKVKNTIDHDKNKPETITQIIQYAYILNKLFNIKVNACEYRYLKQNYSEVITDIDKAFKDFNNNLEQIKKSFENNEFLTNGEDSKCEYCYFRSICPKYESKEDNEDE